MLQDAIHEKEIDVVEEAISQGADVNGCTWLGHPSSWMR